jgi:hypothetical protein
MALRGEHLRSGLKRLLGEWLFLAENFYLN